MHNFFQRLCTVCNAKLTEIYYSKWYSAAFPSINYEKTQLSTCEREVFLLYSEEDNRESDGKASTDECKKLH